MSNDEPKEKNSLWLIAWSFIAVQLALVALLLKRILDRSEVTPPAPQSVQVDARLPETVTIRQERRSEMNWDVLGIAAAAISLVGAAIFYLVGWSYESHWYGYYGINMSQINLSPAQVIVQGVPGVLFSVGAIAVIMGIAAIGKRIATGSAVEARDVPFVFAISYLVATLLLASVVFLLLRSSGQLGNITSGQLENIARISEPSIYTKVLVELGVGLLAALGMAFLASSIVLFRKLSGFLRGVSSHIIDSLAETWRFWLGTVLLLFLFLSTTVSAFLGEFDAQRGARLLEGNWQIPRVNLFSDQEINALQDHEIDTDKKGHEYGPFDLVTSNDSTYFLVKWHEPDDTENHQKPSLYLVPRGGESNLYLLSPTSTPTPTPTVVPESTPSP